MPTATGKRRTLQEAGEASNIQLDWIDGVDPQDIDKDTLPPAKNGDTHSHLRGYSLGAWKAHMNALDSIIEAGVATGVVAEDDIDWDVRIKSQLRSSATAFQALSQPLRYADVRPGSLDYDDLPPFEPAKISPYGDGWDVLWLGHCRMHVEERDQSYPMVVRRGDPTVPEKRHIKTSDIDDQWTFLDDLPEHTRLYYHSRDGLCTLVYAVSYEGARKIRHETGDVMLSGPFDVMLMEYCNLEARPGIGDKTRLKCLSVLPQLFNHWLPGANTSRNIRWSARKNLQQLRDHEGIVAETAPADGWMDSWGG